MAVLDPHLKPDKQSETGELASVLSLCKRRGFLFPGSEIYGGLGSCWDYGPLGVQLKLNIKQQWWNHMTRRADITGLDSSIFMHPRVWEASGHLEGFTDPLSDCRDCKHRFLREINPPEDSSESGKSGASEKALGAEKRKKQTAAQPEKKNQCPRCGSKNITEPRISTLCLKVLWDPWRMKARRSIFVLKRLRGFM